MAPSARMLRFAAVIVLSVLVVINLSGRMGGRAAKVASGTGKRVRHALPSEEPDPLPVPNVVHFIFGMDPNFGHMGFGLIHYLAVLGAHMFIAPKKIQLHYLYEPTGPWWECARPMLELVKEDDVTEVYGKQLKMKVQHKADIIRMNIMLKHGGMYLDSDVIPLRSFQELRTNDLTMGLEGQEGLCNAVMIGKPNTTFINRWWAEYKSFDPEKQWSYHSVQLPRQLQKQHPEEVTVLSERAFFYPSWYNLRAMYDEDDGYDYLDNYAVHLWTSADERQRIRLTRLTISDVFNGEGSFHRVSRILLEKAHAAGKLCDAANEEVGSMLQMYGSEIERSAKKKAEGSGAAPASAAKT